MVLCCHITGLRELRTGASETDFQSYESIKSLMFLSCVVSPASSIQYRLFCVRCSGKLFSCLLMITSEVSICCNSHSLPSLLSSTAVLL